MSKLTDRVSYLKGLADGLQLDMEQGSNKLIMEILNLLGDVTEEMQDMADAHDELDEYVESIDDDLADLEEVLFGDDDDDEDDDECHCGCCDHDDDDECGCGHHHHHHHGHDADEVFDEVGAQTSNKYTKSELEEIIDSLDECGEVLRAKGIVENADGGWLEFDYVPGEGEVRATDAEATGMVAVIGTRLNKDKLKELFKLA